jgi:hypothetical protein
VNLYLSRVVSVCNKKIFGSKCSGSTKVQHLTHKAKFSPSVVNLADVVPSKITLAICEPNHAVWECLT